MCKVATLYTYSRAKGDERKFFVTISEGHRCFERIISDDTWVHFYQLEIKQQISVWKHPNPVKALASKSIGKVMSLSVTPAWGELNVAATMVVWCMCVSPMTLSLVGEFRNNLAKMLTMMRWCASLFSPFWEYHQHWWKLEKCAYKIQIGNFKLTNGKY